MSGVDNRIVSMTFDNASFQNKIGETIRSLDALTKSLTFAGAKNGFSDITKAANGFSLASIGASVDNISSKFSILGAVGFSAIQKITSSVLDSARSLAGVVFDPLIAGGKQRALNIENAKFAFRGLGIDVDKAMASAKEAVLGTAYGLDEAAKAAAIFGGSGIKAGKDMTEALRGIAGVAAVTNTSFTEIAGIYTGIAGTNRLTNQDLNQFATRGINVAASLGKQLHVTEAQVHQMATDGKIDFATFSKAMNDAFGEHATKANETYSGSLANMRAALSRVGAAFFTPLLLKQRDIFNSITPVIDKIGKALTPLVNVFTQIVNIKGDNLIKFIKGIDFTDLEKALPFIAKGIKNLFDGVTNFITPIKEAFRDIFPKNSIVNIVAIASAFANFTEKLKIGESTAIKVMNIFQGLFGVLEIGWTIIKETFKLFSSLFSGFSGGGSGVLEFATKIAYVLYQLNNSLVAGGGIHRFFIRLGEVIKDPGKAIDEFKIKIVDFFNRFNTAIKDPLGFLDEFKDKINKFFNSFSRAPETEAVLGRVQTRFDSLRNAVSKIVSVFEGASAAFDLVKKVFEKILSYITTWFSELGSNVAKSIKPGDFNAGADALNVGLLGGIALLLKKFVDGGLKLDLGNGIFDKIGKTLDGLTGTLKTMQAQVKADILLKIAAAVALLAASMVILSLIDSVALTKALTAMAVGFGQLVAAMALLNKAVSGPKDAAKLAIVAGGLILLAGAMILMSIAIKILSTLSLTELGKGILGIAGALIVIAAAMQLMPPTLPITAAGLVLVGIALGLIGGAIKIFATLSLAELGKGLLGIAGALIVIAATTLLIPPTLPITAAGLVLVGIALNLIAGAVKLFSLLSYSEIGKGLVGIAGALIAISIGTALIPITLPITAAGLILLGIALAEIAGVIKIFASIGFGDLIKGLIGLGASLAIISIAVNLMSNALPGAFALVIVSGALLILVKVLQELAKISIGDLAKGLGAIAAVFAILGLAGLVLAPVIPAILGLGVALALVGGSFALFGVGVFLVAKAFKVFAESGEAGVKAFLNVLELVAQAVPRLIAAFVKSFIASTGSILEAATLLLKLVTVLIDQVLETIIKLLPKFVKTVGVIITELLKLIKEKVPEFVDAGFVILIAFLKGIRDNIVEITNLGVEIIDKFSKALSDNGQTIIDVGLRVLFSFLTAIGNRAEDIAAAGLNLLLNFLLGITDNIFKIIETVAQIIAKFITEITNNYLTIINAGADALVKFLEGIARDIYKVGFVAADVVIAFIRAIGDNSLRVINAAADMLIDFLNGLANVIRERTPELRTAGLNIASAIIDGMTGGLSSQARNVANSAIDVARNAVSSVRNFLGANSPSKVFIEIGNSMAEGLVYALDNDTTSTASAVQHAERVVTAFHKSLSKIPDSLAGLDEFNPVITPVLDLTKVQAASKNIGDFMTVSKLTPDVSFGQAKLISAATENSAAKTDIATPAGPSEIKFEQNNYSPTALSTNDIYRNTKSQIVLAKEKLGVT